MVDEHARELVADRSLHERGGYRRVDATRKPAHDSAVADLRADRGQLVVDDVRRGPAGLETSDVVEEALQHLLAALGVQHLGVELHPREPAGDVLEGRDLGSGGLSGHGETSRRG